MRGVSPFLHFSYRTFQFKDLINEKEFFVFVFKNIEKFAIYGLKCILNSAVLPSTIINDTIEPYRETSLINEI